MSEEAIKKKYSVQIFRPEGTATGITVFLPGTMLKLEEYASTYQVLVEQHQIVIAFNKLNPFTQKHDSMAEKVAGAVAEFRDLQGDAALPRQYNIVGHSLGGKVALMVAAKFDIDNVKTVIALDPVDDKPQELTAPRSSPKTNLSDSKAEEIHLFQSEKGAQRVWSNFFVPLCPSDRNATVLKEVYPELKLSLTIDKGAGHMSYLDTKTEDADVKCREVVQAKIRAVIS